eukprot:scaffold9592_cov22-Tisochrysis_lutea.AAC.2
MQPRIEMRRTNNQVQSELHLVEQTFRTCVGRVCSSLKHKKENRSVQGIQCKSNSDHSGYVCFFSGPNPGGSLYTLSTSVQAKKSGDIRGILACMALPAGVGMTLPAMAGSVPTSATGQRVQL